MAAQRPEVVRGDRRVDQRFGALLDCRYSVPGRRPLRGAGTLLNISRSGALFTCDLPVASGTTVELCVDWPFRLQNGGEIRLMLRGPVVRSTGNTAAVRIERHELRAAAYDEPQAVTRRVLAVA